MLCHSCSPKTRADSESVRPLSGGEWPELTVRSMGRPNEGISYDAKSIRKSDRLRRGVSAAEFGWHYADPHDTAASAALHQAQRRGLIRAPSPSIALACYATPPKCRGCYAYPSDHVARRPTSYVFISSTEE
jgi:hypothetical protein